MATSLVLRKASMKEKKRDFRCTPSPTSGRVEDIGPENVFSSRDDRRALVPYVVGEE
ncbi:MAG: hypothetical protein ACFCD0_13665 [Gemmataceae bacterium]